MTPGTFAGNDSNDEEGRHTALGVGTKKPLYRFLPSKSGVRLDCTKFGSGIARNLDRSPFDHNSINTNKNRTPGADVVLGKQKAIAFMRLSAWNKNSGNGYWEVDNAMTPGTFAGNDSNDEEGRHTALGVGTKKP
nr:hypothetical protein [Tanacetum cinerariifolium]